MSISVVEFDYGLRETIAVKDGNSAVVTGMTITMLGRSYHVQYSNGDEQWLDENDIKGRLANHIN
jgi:hypothetical protein